jgi:two-component system OmpR family response regulator
MRILLIEDDVETAYYVSHCLADAGHDTSVESDGNDGLARAYRELWDVLIVDRMLPGLDGLSVVRDLRASGAVMPILFLTTMAGVDDRVQGLNAGGDDYLVKPFSPAELLARVAAVCRRSALAAQPTKLKVADLEIDLLSRTATRAGAIIALMPREYRLLEYLMKHAGQIVTRTMLLENVWDVHFDPHTTVVETHISRLRGKIDRGHAVELIHTLRGTGYCLHVAG